MKLYREFLAGNWQEAKRIQFSLLPLINAMLYGANFPEGFRAGMSLRGFNLGSTRQLLSPKEQCDLEEIRSKIACLLADCGFQEAAGACRRPGGGASPGSLRGSNPPESAPSVDTLVREIMAKLQAGQTPG